MVPGIKVDDMSMGINSGEVDAEALSGLVPPRYEAARGFHIFW